MGLLGRTAKRGWRQCFRICGNTINSTAWAHNLGKKKQAFGVSPLFYINLFNLFIFITFEDIMDELGSRIRHNDNPNLQIVPFFFTERAVSYSLAWPVRDIHGTKKNKTKQTNKQTKQKKTTENKKTKNKNKRIQATQLFYNLKKNYTINSHLETNKM
jgi:hypothetical protein